MSPMSWEEYERGQEMAAMGEVMASHLQALLDERGDEGFARMNRSLYRYTVCGAYLGLRLWGGEFVWSHDKRLPTIRPGDVQSIGVGTIVEGTDAAPEMEWLDLLTYAEDEDASRLIADFDAAVQRIEDAAQDIWNETHGCDECVKHGGTAVDPNCPSCGGEGVAI